MEVSNAGPGCGKANLRTRINLRARGTKRPLTIRPHDKRSLGVPITMRAQAPGACRGARFPLHFQATFGRAP